MTTDWGVTGCLASLSLGLGLSFLLLSGTSAKSALHSDACVPCTLPFLYQDRLHFECTSSSPVTGDLFGRCPNVTNPRTGEASLSPGDWVRCDDTCPLQKYTRNSELVSHLERLTEKFPQLAKIVEVGTSGTGQRFVGLRISGDVRKDRRLLTPMVRYSGNMHGNEPVGREMLAHLASYLLHAYSRVPRVTHLIDSTDITIIPTINPDGFDRGTEGACVGGDYATGRYNEGDRDLNRDFPTWREANQSLSSLQEGRQRETQAMMSLILSQPWVLSANFHDGAVVASYPYDDYRDDQAPNGIHKTPDHQFFKHLAKTYASNHLTMMDPTVCPKWWFTDGITNGAEWYPLNGGMQDFNYLFSNDMEITLELSCCKYPKKYYLNQEWERNRDSLLAYIEQVHRGVKGRVFDSAGEVRPEAVIFVEKENSGLVGRNVTTSNRGEFWKLLMPGSYIVRAEYRACETGGVVLQSEPIQVTLTEASPLSELSVTLDGLTSCQTGPR